MIHKNEEILKRNLRYKSHTLSNRKIFLHQFKILDMLYKNKKIFLSLNNIKNKVQKSKSDTN